MIAIRMTVAKCRMKQGVVNDYKENELEQREKWLKDYAKIAKLNNSAK